MLREGGVARAVKGLESSEARLPYGLLGRAKEYGEGFRLEFGAVAAGARVCAVNRYGSATAGAAATTRPVEIAAARL